MKALWINRQNEYSECNTIESRIYILRWYIVDVGISEQGIENRQQCEVLKTPYLEIKGFSTSVQCKSF